VLVKLVLEVGPQVAGLHLLLDPRDAVLRQSADLPLLLLRLGGVEGTRMSSIPDHALLVCTAPHLLVHRYKIVLGSSEAV